MTDHTNWLITLDFSPIDNIILKYAKKLADLVNPDQIHFIHVKKEVDELIYLPETLRAPKGKEDEALRNKMKKEVEVFKFPVNVSNHHVEQGDIVQEVLKHVIKDDIQLVMIGKKISINGLGITPERLSKKLPCSFLYIPENAKPKFNRILSAIDFSDHSKLALKNWANYIIKNANTTLVGLHVYQIPADYPKTGKNYQQILQLVQDQVDNQLEEISNSIAKIDKKISLLLKDAYPADLIYQTAIEEKIDLIVIGSKGRTKAKMMLLGSTATRLLKISDDLPIMVIKKKEENLEFIKAAGLG